MQAPKGRKTHFLAAKHELIVVWMFGSLQRFPQVQQTPGLLASFFGQLMVREALRH